MSSTKLKQALDRLRSLPGPPAPLAAATVSCVAAFGIATAFAAEDPTPETVIEEPGQYPATPRVAVANGTIRGVGAYELLRSRDYTGGLCVGILLEGADPHGYDVLSEGCGGPEDLNIGKVTARDGSWTILNGKVPEQTADIRVERANEDTIAVPVVNDSRDIDGRWVVKKLDGRVADVRFEAVDASGRVLASMELGSNEP